MPSWILPGSATTGNPIPASWGNDVNGDLTILETQVGLLGVGTMFTGTAATPGAPNWYMQGGTVHSMAFSGGFGPAVIFPTPFPNGALTLQVAPSFSASTAAWTLNVSGFNTLGFSLTATQNGSAYTGGLDVCWFAIGT